jgi:hypothetical protein
MNGGMTAKEYFLGMNGKSSSQNTPSTSTTSGILNSSYFSPSTVFGNTLYTGMNPNNSSKMGMYIKQILSYLFGIAIVILIIMLFIHFFITPVFSLQPGAPGIFVVPGLDDGVLFWNKLSPAILPNKDLPIQNMDYGYSFIIDIFIENPHVHFSKYPRILFRRGGTLRSTPTAGETLLSLLDNYNMVAALMPETNDLMVSVLNSNNNQENVIISNIPVQDPFRVGVVILDYVMEVYVNGHLMKTRTFSAVPKSIKGDIYPIRGTESSMAKMRNLKIWSRPLTSSEIRYAEPTMSTGKDFGSGQMATTSSCDNLNNEGARVSEQLRNSVNDAARVFSNTTN